MSNERPVRWAHLDEIDYRTRPGSTAWFMRHSVGAQHLSAFRALHAVHEGHDGVHDYAVEQGRESAGDLSLAQMLMGLRQ